MQNNDSEFLKSITILLNIVYGGILSITIAKLYTYTTPFEVNPNTVTIIFLYFLFFVRWVNTAYITTLDDFKYFHDNKTALSFFLDVVRILIDLFSVVILGWLIILFLEANSSFSWVFLVIYAVSNIFWNLASFFAINDDMSNALRSVKLGVLKTIFYALPIALVFIPEEYKEPSMLGYIFFHIILDTLYLLNQYSKDILQKKTQEVSTCLKTIAK